MVGAVCVVGSSSIVDSKTCGCFLSADLIHHPIGRKVELNTSFLDNSRIRALTRASFLRRKARKNRRRSIVVMSGTGTGTGNGTENQEDNFDDVKQQILDYFTYKAVRTVLNQLYEMNPTQYRWFYNYIASNELGYGKTFIRKLVKEKLELAERVMVTRLHLYQRWTKFCDHSKMYERISDQNVELMRERLMETVIWPSDDTKSEGEF